MEGKENQNSSREEDAKGQGTEELRECVLTEEEGLQQALLDLWPHDDADDQGAEFVAGAFAEKAEDAECDDQEKVENAAVDGVSSGQCEEEDDRDEQ